MDYSSLIPSFDNVVPELLDKKNKLILTDGSGIQPVGDLASALKKEGYDVAVVAFEGSMPELPKGIEGHKKFEDAAAPGAVAVIMTSASKSLEAIKAAMIAGVDRIWLEIGSETAEAIEFLSGAHATAVYQMPIAREALNEAASEAMKFQRKDS